MTDKFIIFGMSSESLALSKVEWVETPIAPRKNSERFLDFAALRSE